MVIRSIVMRIVCLSLFFLGHPIAGQAQGKLLWGDLKQGAYAVGFRMLYQTDYTRLYDTGDQPIYDVEDPAGWKRSVKKTYRPLFIAVWYPARKTNHARMTYQDYLSIVSKDQQFAEFSKRLQTASEDVVREEVIGSKNVAEWRKEQNDAWQTFMGTRTYAVRDAAPVAGRFPVVLNHSGLGGSYEDNSALFEYLASYGYVVISSAYQREDPNKPNIDWDFPRSFKDLAFLLQYARTLPNVDADHLAVMGHSFGAQAILGWRAEVNSSVDAAVTLDSSIEYSNTEKEFLENFTPLKSLLDGNTSSNIWIGDARKNNCPLLRFASHEGEPNFDVLEKYIKYSPRYEAETTSLRHNDYLTHGAVRRAFFPAHEKDEPDGETRRASYFGVCQTVRAFLDLALKHDTTGEAFLKRSMVDPGATTKFTLRYRDPAPTPQQLSQVIRSQGFAAGENLIRRFHDDFSSYIMHPTCRSLKTDVTKEDCLRLINLWIEKRPNSSLASNNLGDYYRQFGEKDKALAAYQKALELMPTDPDPFLADSAVRLVSWRDFFVDNLKKRVAEQTSSH